MHSNDFFLTHAHITIHLKFLSFRCFTTTKTVQASLINKISRKHGIPERPKKPMHPFLRYLVENRSQIHQTVGDHRKVFVAASVQWKKLDENQKQKYKDEYTKEHVVYKQKMAEYEKKLTKDQKLVINDERIRLKEEKVHRAELRNTKNRLKELGKPTRSPSSYLIFVSEQRKQSVSMKDAQQKWNQMNEEQKRVYQQKQIKLSEAYK